MSAAHIALSRFGYGLRLGERPPTDPKRYLLGQLEAFDPAPTMLNGREDTSARAGEILELLRNNRAMRRDAQMAENPASEQMAPSMETARKNRRQNSQLDDLPDELKQAYANGGQILRSDIRLKVGMAVESGSPMVERLVHFWSNHFSVSAGKVGTQHQVGNLEFFAIRPNVLGKFSDMLKAASLHPAMLLYLDQFQSVGPNAPMQQRRGRQQAQRRGLNENLAREIMELHTLGVHGGYSQADVTEFARALTGWTVSGLRRLGRFTVEQPGGASFAEVAHEPGTRTIMGKSYRANGAKQALDVLDDLAAHPSTARFVATKLARHFAGDTPPPDLVARLEQDFLSTGGDLASLTRTLIEAPEAWVEGPVKYRQPFEWLISTMRLVGARGSNGQQAANMLQQLGQRPWAAPSPAGYDDIEGSWAGPDALYRRVDLAERIASRVGASDVLEQAEAAFPGALSEHTRLWLSRAESDQQALGLLLVSPEMLRR